MDALKRRQNAEDVGSATGATIASDNSGEAFSDETCESEYETELEEAENEDVVNHNLFTPEYEHRLVNNEDTPEEAFSTPSLDSVGKTIKVVEMEG